MQYVLRIFITTTNNTLLIRYEESKIEIKCCPHKKLHFNTPKNYFFKNFY